MGPYLSWLFSMLLFAVTIRNLWPQKMGPTGFAVLYLSLSCAALPIPLLTLKQYGLFGIFLAACLYGLLSYPKTRPQNICMGFCGCVLALVLENLFVGLQGLLPFPSLWESSNLKAVLYLLFYYAASLLCGKLFWRMLYSRISILRTWQVWYLFDAGLLLLLLIFVFYAGVRDDASPTASLVYYNSLFFAGYLLVAVFLALLMLRTYREKTEAETRQRALQDLQDYTRTLEAMYDRLRAFKHDYINILISMSGYIESGEIAGLKEFFEQKILPTRQMLTQGDHKLDQLGRVEVLEIKSLLCAKMIHAHELGVGLTIDIPEPVTCFWMDTVDLARVLGIFLDNALEAALEAASPEIGLNILQNRNQAAVIITNTMKETRPALHKLKQQGFTTKQGHAGIGLANAQKILRPYGNILWETSLRDGRFTQYLEINREKG